MTPIILKAAMTYNRALLGVQISLTSLSASFIWKVKGFIYLGLPNNLCLKFNWRRLFITTMKSLHSTVVPKVVFDLITKGEESWAGESSLEFCLWENQIRMFWGAPTWSDKTCTLCWVGSPMLRSNDEKYALKELLDWWEIKSHKKILVQGQLWLQEMLSSILKIRH